MVNAEIKFIFEILNFLAVVPYRYVKFYSINRSGSDEKREISPPREARLSKVWHISSVIPVHLLHREPAIILARINSENMEIRIRPCRPTANNCILAPAHEQLLRDSAK